MEVESVFEQYGRLKMALTEPIRFELIYWIYNVSSCSKDLRMGEKKEEKNLLFSS